MVTDRGRVTAYPETDLLPVRWLLLVALDVRV